MAEANDIAIKVEAVSKIFKLPHEKTTSIKSALISGWRKSRTYEKQLALNDISFEVKKGEFFGIVGRNGSGKSTLLKLLAGIYVPTKGKIDVHGSLTPFIELGVGFNQELTGRENVFLNGALLGFNRKQMQTMYKDIVGFAELERFMDQKLKNYSSGMQVRLAFSIAIRAKGDMLLLDEVLAVGDAAFQRKCYNYFEELKQQNRTVVFVSHDMGAIRRFCTKAIYVKNGKLTHQGKPVEIADIYTRDNMGEPGEDNALISDKHKVGVSIASQTDKKLQTKITYSSKDNESVYVGISVLREGISVAEIITPPDFKLTGSGSLEYDLDLSIFNGGLYQIAVALFHQKNQELIAISKNREFIIEGHDPIKGAALKLMDTWVRGK